MRRISVETAEEMRKAVEAELPADIGIFAAAVGDWRIANMSAEKIKKTAATKVPSLLLAENPDILASIAVHAKRPKLIVGFAAETENVVENAIAKQIGKGADWIVANDVSGDVMGGHRNRVHLVTADGIEDWPEDSKQEVARHLIHRVAQEIG